MMKSSPTAFLVVLLIGFFITSALSAPIAGQQQIQQQESDATVGELIEDVMTTASEVGTASYALYKYISEELLSEQAPPQAPCFIRDRTSEELSLSPLTDYKQLLLEDHQSASNYVDYISRVEVQYNDTMNANPGCGYCTRFTDTKKKMEQLLAKLDSLAEAVNVTTSQSSDTTPSQDQETEDTAKEDTSNDDSPTATATVTTTSSSSDVPEYCSNLCPEQQVEIFTRLVIFASIYVQRDLGGLMEQLKDS